MSSVTLGELAKILKMDIDVVRDILIEKLGIKSDKTMMEHVFQTAQKAGYDFGKLKVGKRMDLRKEVVLEIVKQIKTHPDWTRKEILDYLVKISDLVRRIHKRVFQEEFGK